MQQSQSSGSALQHDPRIAEAKRLLKEAVHDHQKELTAVRPALPGLKHSYTDMLNAMERIRGQKLWYPYLGSGIGNGPFVELADGSVKYDFIGGIGVHFFGHSQNDIIDAVIDASISNTVMQGNLQQNVDSLELMEMLSKASGLDHCFLTTSGAMANENAFKIAFQKHAPAYRVLAFDRCFAGRSTMLSQVTDKPTFREGLPRNVFVDYIPFFDPGSPHDSTERTVAELKKAIARYPGEHALMCFEFVQGEGGFYTGTKEFFTTLMTILKEHKIAIFADEVQSFGRTPHLFAYQHFGLERFVDIASAGKLLQVCATFFTDEYKPKPGLLSQTFTSSTAAIHASKSVLKHLLEGGFFGQNGKIQKLHNYFAGKLAALSEKHPALISGPFGIGAMVVFTPYDGDVNKTTNFLHRLFDAGLIGFIAGSSPVRVRLLIPAGVLTERDIDNAVKIIETTLLHPT